MANNKIGKLTNKLIIIQDKIDDFGVHWNPNYNKKHSKLLNKYSSIYMLRFKFQGDL